MNERQALMKLIAIDTEPGPWSQAEFDENTKQRREALTLLMRSNDPLLNEVAVAASRKRSVWLQSPVGESAEEWLRNQQRERN